jgi:hut operon positive regulatory protein
MFDNVRSVGTAAMLLALTRTMQDEEAVKKMLSSQGFRFVVTEVGGNSAQSEFQMKATKAVIGACMNTGLIAKTPTNYHALLHATDEAKRGIMVNVASSTSVAVKIAVVRDEHWIAVALFGESALHPLTNHDRAGLGVMHLGADA